MQNVFSSRDGALQKMNEKHWPSAEKVEIRAIFGF